MPVDKTIIKVPKIAFTQLYPNVVNNISQLTYNEGIYLSSNSLNKTFPKSVVRIYKNPSYPKKIYLLSKDTSLIQAASEAFSSFDSSSASTVVENSMLQKYFSSESFDKFSKFIQPENFTELASNSELKNKTINFYTISDEAILDMASTLDGEFVEGKELWRSTPSYVIGKEDYEKPKGLLLKSKSIISDYNDSQSDNDKSTAIFYNAALYPYWFENSASIDKLQVLSDGQISLLTTTTITKTKTIDFSKYVDKKYENLRIQKIDAEVYPAGLGRTYIMAQENTSYSEDDDSRWFPMFDTSDDVEGTATFQDGTPYSYLKDKFLYIQKQDLILGSHSNERELFSLNQGNPFGLFERIISGDGATGTFTYYGALSRVTKTIFEQEYEMFVPDKNWINTYYDGNIEKSPLNYTGQTSDRVKQFTENFIRDVHLSTFYIFNDLYDSDRASGLGRIVPDDPDKTIIYEIELEQELEFENGTFVVVEIE